jgi:protein-tyrosine phosphatase
VKQTPAFSDGAVRLVDLHTHMVPSGDDGVRTIEEAFSLCSEAADRGTRVLYATPHVNDELPLLPERELLIREAAASLGELLRPVGLEVRVGFELHPTVTIRDADLRRYRMDDFEAVLLESPLEKGARYDVDQIFAAAERIEAAGVLPVLAHPERSPAFLEHQTAATEAAARGWLLQVTAASLHGRNGDAVARFAWSLLERGDAQLVASDAHRPDRPPFLDEAYTEIARRLGTPQALRLLDATALRVAAAC